MSAASANQLCRKGSSPAVVAPPQEEFSYVVMASALGPDGDTHRFAATPAQRQALAERFGLLELSRFEATAVVARATGQKGLRSRIHFEAEVVQSCVVTLEPVPALIEEDFAVLFRPEPGAAKGVKPGEIVVSLDDEEAEPLVDDRIDIGAVTAEHLALAIDPYPRKPGAAIIGLAPENGANRPFAVLERLKKRPESG